jgi:exonuclease III
MNVKGLKGEGKRRKVIKWATRKNFDIMTMQETHFEEKDKNDWKEIWDGTLIYSSGSNRSRGVITLINKNTEHEIISEYQDNEGRWTVIKLKIYNMILTLANFYGPNEDEPIHLTNMLEKIEQTESEKIIIVGDFNFVQNVNLDKFGGLKKTNFKCQKVGLEWMATNNISDIWRLKNPNSRKYTWISNSTPKIMSRLDYFLLSDNLQGCYEKADIIPGFMTDHSCITLSLKINEEQRGRGLWKFNSTLTNNKQLKDQLNNIITQTVKENQEADDCILWGLIEMQN